MMSPSCCLILYSQSLPCLEIIKIYIFKLTEIFFFSLKASSSEEKFIIPSCLLDVVVLALSFTLPFFLCLLKPPLSTTSHAFALHFCRRVRALYSGHYHLQATKYLFLSSTLSFPIIPSSSFYYITRRARCFL